MLRFHLQDEDFEDKEFIFNHNDDVFIFKFFRALVWMFLFYFRIGLNQDGYKMHPFIINGLQTSINRKLLQYLCIL